jgi:hypothetical protein
LFDLGILCKAKSLLFRKTGKEWEKARQERYFSVCDRQKWLVVDKMFQRISFCGTIIVSRESVFRQIAKSGGLLLDKKCVRIIAGKKAFWRKNKKNICGRNTAKEK